MAAHHKRNERKSVDESVKAHFARRYINYEKLNRTGLTTTVLEDEKLYLLIQ
jgi:hypothetical protein